MVPELLENVAISRRVMAICAVLFKKNGMLGEAQTDERKGNVRATSRNDFMRGAYWKMARPHVAARSHV
jgi:hypothetical protein